MRNLTEMSFFNTKRLSLSAYQIKCAALFFMTIDHIGKYAFELPFVSNHITALHILGRIAAPLFLFLLTESAHHTHNKIIFLLRIYLSSVLFSILNIGMNAFLGKALGVFTHGNILYTYAFILAYIILIEDIFQAIRLNKKRKLVITILLMSSSLLLHPLWQYIHSINTANLFIKYFLECFIQSPLLVEYAPSFILLGIAMYFIKNKWIKIVCFAFLCIISYNDNTGMYLGGVSFEMLLSVPIMCMYNGTKGAECKLFFYLYYPLHIYIIIILARILEAAI